MTADWQDLGEGVWAVATQRFRDSATGSVTLHALDLDSTLVATRSGNVHAKTPQDWRWWHEGVPAKLRGLTVLIVTNQLRGAKGGDALTGVLARVAAVVGALDERGVAVAAVAATLKNACRKPGVGAWQRAAAALLPHATPQLAVYVGDAAGRPADFSDSDAKFAANLGCPFQTPEQFFLGHAVDVPPLPDWVAVLEEHRGRAWRVAAAPGQEVVVLVGAPASGKSALAATVFGAYAAVSRDVLGTAAKCAKAVAAALAAGRSVVVDNTNPTVAARAPFVAAAQAAGVPARAVHVVTDRPLRDHLHGYREAMGGRHVPAVAVATYYKRLQPPGVGRGLRTW